MAVFSMLIFVFWAYLVGSINLTKVAVRVLGLKDLSDTGSKNPGVTNLYRAAGAKVAFPILIMELTKAFIGLYPVIFFGEESLIPYLIAPYVLGSIFPIFHAFEGGKGVAAVVGSMLAADYRIMLSGGLVFILVFVFTRKVSPSSLAMMLSYPVFAFIYKGFDILFAICIYSAVIVCITHRENIKRLLRGEEPLLKRNR